MLLKDLPAEECYAIASLATRLDNIWTQAIFIEHFGGFRIEGKRDGREVLVWITNDLNVLVEDFVWAITPIPNQFIPYRWNHVNNQVAIHAHFKTLKLTT